MASRFCPGSALARVFAISRSWGPIALGGTSRYGAAVGRKGNEIWHLANAVTWLTRPEGSTALIFVGIFAATVLTCSSLVAVDGDTIRCGTERMRDMGPGSPFRSGYDAPEIRNAKCPKERLLGEQAKARLQELLEMPGIRVEDSGVADRYGRPLVVVRLRDGKTAGEVLIREGYAVRWQPGYRSNWCR